MLTGMSNGAEMGCLMAYIHPDFFNAIAPIAGLTMEWMRKELKAKGPVPMMEVHGTQDHTSEWKGSIFSTGRPDSGKMRHLSSCCTVTGAGQ